MMYLYIIKETTSIHHFKNKNMKIEKNFEWFQSDNHTFVAKIGDVVITTIDDLNTCEVETPADEESWTDCGTPDFQSPSNAEWLESPEGIRAWVSKINDKFFFGQVADADDTAHFWGADLAAMRGEMQKTIAVF